MRVIAGVIGDDSSLPAPTASPSKSLEESKEETKEETKDPSSLVKKAGKSRPQPLTGKIVVDWNSLSK